MLFTRKQVLYLYYVRGALSEQCFFFEALLSRFSSLFAYIIYIVYKTRSIYLSLQMSLCLSSSQKPFQNAPAKTSSALTPRLASPIQHTHTHTVIQQSSTRNTYRSEKITQRSSRTKRVQRRRCAPDKPHEPYYILLLSYIYIIYERVRGGASDQFSLGPRAHIIYRSRTFIIVLITCSGVSNIRIFPQGNYQVYYTS